MRCVSTIVRRTPASVSDNLRRKRPSIARRAVHHCAPLHLWRPERRPPRPCWPRFRWGAPCSDAFEEREGRDLNAFLHRISLDTKDDDEGADSSDQVTLVTLHGAKGLEFQVVFMVGVEEELLPHKRTLYPEQTQRVLSRMLG